MLSVGFGVLRGIVLRVGGAGWLVLRVDGLLLRCGVGVVEGCRGGLGVVRFGLGHRWVWGVLWFVLLVGHLGLGLEGVLGVVVVGRWVGLVVVVGRPYWWRMEIGERKIR